MPCATPVSPRHTSASFLHFVDEPNRSSTACVKAIKALLLFQSLATVCTRAPSMNQNQQLITSRQHASIKPLTRVRVPAENHVTTEMVATNEQSNTEATTTSRNSGIGMPTVSRKYSWSYNRAHLRPLCRVLHSVPFRTFPIEG